MIFFRLFNEHELFKMEIQSRQDELEETLKVMKKVGFAALPQDSPCGTPTSKNALISLPSSLNIKPLANKLSLALTPSERNNSFNSK